MHSRSARKVDAHAVELDDAVRRRRCERRIRARQRAASSAASKGLLKKSSAPEIERLDLVGERAARGENQRRQGLAGAAQAAHQAQAVGAGQADIDHRHGEFFVRERRLRGLGAARPDARNSSAAARPRVMASATMSSSSTIRSRTRHYYGYEVG